MIPRPNYRLTISGGNGPKEVQAFVAKLAPALEALCHSRSIQVTQGVPQVKAALSLSIELRGEDLDSALQDILGTHCLVHQSQTRSKRARKRWYAGVQLVSAERAKEVLDLKDVTIQAIRSRGPAGQHVNTTSSACRLTHHPTGITIRSEDERSQAANRRQAIKRLKQALLAREAEGRTKAKVAAHRRHRAFERGNAIVTWRIGHRGDLEQVSENKEGIRAKRHGTGFDSTAQGTR